MESIGYYNHTVNNIVQKVAVGGIIIQDNKVLIVQRSSEETTLPNLWELPSGKKEALESAIDAVIREVNEEVALKTEIVGIVNTINYQIDKGTEIRDVTQINFSLKLLDGPAVMLSNEHQNFAWVTKRQLKDYNLSDETKESIEKAFISV